MLMYRYKFAPLPSNPSTPIYIYAWSEERARKKHLKWFGIEAGALISRDPW